MEYSVGHDAESAFEYTLQFWEGKKKCKITRNLVDEETNDRLIIVKHGRSFHSLGENITMHFIPENEKTLIHVTVELITNRRGEGGLWKTSSDLLEEWAWFLGTESQDFGSKQYRNQWIIGCTVVPLGFLLAFIIVFLLYPLWNQ